MKKKLKLNDLKVSSFKTNLKESDVETVQGGRQPFTYAAKYCAGTNFCSKLYVCETYELINCNWDLDTLPINC